MSLCTFLRKHFSRHFRRTRPRGVYRRPSPCRAGYWRVEVWAADGVLLSESDVHPRTMDQHWQRPFHAWLDEKDRVAPPPTGHGERPVLQLIRCQRAS